MNGQEDDTMRSLRWYLAAAVAGAVLTATGVAIAHDTPNTRRTVAQCATLPAGERAACVACVGRPHPHHFHPREAAGTRCDPNDGVAR